jgi:hypothetical protein
MISKKMLIHKKIMNILFFFLVFSPREILSQGNDLEQFNYPDDIVWNNPNGKILKYLR